MAKKDCNKYKGTGFIKQTPLLIDDVEYDKYSFCDCDKQQTNTVQQRQDNNKNNWWKEREG